jgi:indole-3-glycerol phosphate synthase
LNFVSSPLVTGHILDTIVASKRAEIARLPARTVDAEMLRATIARRGGLRDFYAALARPRRGDTAVIAEVKQASPSAGIIRADFDPVRIASAYDRAGASCLSVLTDEPFFRGSLEHLRAVRSATNLPLLRKDFLLDERQILEAVEAGADAILLIVAILTDDDLDHLHALAMAAGLTALVEVHDELELERALRCGARVVGINNRNLKTFEIDLGTTERLGALLASSDVEAGIVLVAESGIHSRGDVSRVRRAGARAVLVGESLMRAGDIDRKMNELTGDLRAISEKPVASRIGGE